MVKLSKKACALVLACVMTAGLITGCGKKPDNQYTPEETGQQKVMVVGDQDVYLNEVFVYLIQTLYIQGVTMDSLTDEFIESTKSSVIDSVRQTKIMYDVALNNDFQLEDGDREAIDNAINNTKKIVTESFLKDYGITDEVLNKVYTEQYAVEKFSAQINDDMYNTILSDYLENYEQYRFVTIYMMQFPIVEVDESDEPKKDEDGNYIYVSDEEKEKALDNAKKALAEYISGGSYTDIAAKYGVENYSYENNGYIGGYSDEMNAMLEEMSKGDCTDILEDTLAYSFFIVTNDNNEDAKKSYAEMNARTLLDSEFKELQSKWLSTIPVDEEGDMNGTVWADFDMKRFVENMSAYNQSGQ